MTDPAIDALRRGRERIAKGWCQGEYARTAKNRRCAPNSPRATQWCVTGAVMNEELYVPFHVWQYLIHSIGCLVQSWNDDPSRTQAEVLAAFDRAIALASEEAP